MKKITIRIILVLAIFMAYGMNGFSQGKSSADKETVMKRFLVVRTFPEGLNIPVNAEGSKICLSVVTKNATENVTWIQSYVSMDKKKTYCIYDAPSAEAIKKSAKLNGLPVDTIVEVSVLDPYFYK